MKLILLFLILLQINTYTIPAIRIDWLKATLRNTFRRNPQRAQRQRAATVSSQSSPAQLVMPPQLVQPQSDPILTNIKKRRSVAVARRTASEPILYSDSTKNEKIERLEADVLGKLEKEDSKKSLHQEVDLLKFLLAERKENEEIQQQRYDLLAARVGAMENSFNNLSGSIVRIEQLLKNSSGNSTQNS